MSKIYCNKPFTFLLVFFAMLAFQTKTVAQCEIWDMTVVTECVPNTVTFNAVINFNHQNTSDSFKLQGSGNNYGFFAYADLPITLTGLEGNCTTQYEFVAKDKVTPTCLDFVEVGTVCCGTGDCSINIVDFESSDCINDSSITVSFDLEYNNTGNLGFDVFDQNGFVAFFLYSQLPATIGSFSAPFNQEFIYIQVCDNDNSNCCDVFEFANPCYLGNNCEIWDMTVETECNPGTTLFDAVINFNHSQTSDSFEIVGNGLNYGTFSYASLPITLTGLQGNCTTQYEFLARDVVTNSCSDFVDVGQVCCSSSGCSIEIVDFEVGDCQGGENVVVSFDLNYSNTGNLGFDVFDANGFAAYFLYSQLPVTVTGISAPPSQQNIFIQVCDNDNPNCCDVIEFPNPCYQQNTCDIWDMTVETICDSSQALFSAIINFNHSNTSDSFKILGNGLNYGTFPYSALPLTLSGLEANCSTNYEFVAKDFVDNSCSDFVNVGQVCCGNNGNCEIWDMTVETICDSSQTLFTAIINFNHNNTSDSFKIVGNGINYGHFAYASLPISISGLEANCTTNYEFVARDLVENSCTGFVDVGQVCCGNNNSCSINIDGFTVSDCQNNESVTVTFDLDYNNTGNLGFDVSDGNGYTAFFLYSQLPVTIANYPASPGQAILHLMVCDNDNPNCCDVIEFTNPCYVPAPQCQIDSLSAEVTYCDSTSFDVTINFVYNNVSDSFKIAGNGIIYGFFAYSDLPITLSGLNADCSTNYEFVVIDQQNAQCAEDIGIGEVCCSNFNSMANVNYIFTIHEIENIFDVDLSFTNTLTPNCHFIVKVNGDSTGVVTNSDSHFTIPSLSCSIDHDVSFISSCSQDTVYHILIEGDVACQINNTTEPSALQIYYDINNQTFSIERKENTALTITIYDSYGRVVSVVKTHDSTYKGYLGHLPPSLYLIKAASIETKSSKISKVIISR